MNNSEWGTIAAIATPQGYGGISVIRISGNDALSHAQNLLKPNDRLSAEPNKSEFHLLIDSETEITIDEAVITYFKAPHSFTGEDVIEIACHGSPVVLTELMRLLIKGGAQPAQPGEFSMRAFLNRKIDLTQAEAINDLIHSQTSYQARIAASQLRGELAKQLRPIKDGLIEFIVHFESTVEFVEDDLDPLNIENYVNKLDEIIQKLNRLASSYRYGRIIRSGIKLALIGKPNVGKSSLFNSLLGRDRAIVTHIPGTTRDTLNESFSINGIPVNLVDTAGIRDTEDIVERIGVERTMTAITEADIVVEVLDGSVDEVIDENEFPVGIYVINKSDLSLSIPPLSIDALRENHDVIQVSALKGDGIDELKQLIYKRIIGSKTPMMENAVITNERHFAAIEEAIESIQKARADLKAGFTEEIALANLHKALRSLGVITGETLIGDIINQIFSTFCIGK